ncbi:MAG: DNA mismatch repair endonuclease MutL [Verrucomicrobia bacterium]|nr:MAG: DNA mismatch repair endonuclease MutL [Verrucomicrobiota bacterium]
MSLIRILPDRVANQIAAGEVVERPASIVKELIENSLDAGATRVEVEFRHGGRSFIRVEDNGRGMSRDDALLSLERHATSKIREAGDLDKVLSFGFRGEALPSIASVSKFTLQTRDAGSETGTEIVVNGGKVVHVRDCGMPVGTRIVVANLFNSVPARRKFLKSDATEAAHIIHQTRLHALACPEVAFTLLEDGRLNFKSPGCPSLKDRIEEVFGRRIASELIEVAAEEGGMRLRGLISRPGVARSTRHEMITFVNRRPVDSRTLAYALLESYHAHIPKGRYPMAFLFLDIDPARVDVNVHPAKREIRFREEAKVRGFTIRAVLEALRLWQEQALPEAVPGRPVQPAAEGAGQTEPPGGQSPNLSRTAAAQRDDGSASPRPGPQTPTGRVPAAPPAEISPAGGGRARKGEAGAEPSDDAQAGTAPPATASSSARDEAGREDDRTSAPAGVDWRALGPLQGGYWLFESPRGLVILDVRAAAERVWYERLERQTRDGRVEIQQLLLPVVLELEPVAAAAVAEQREFLHAHGFVVEPFGRHMFRLEATPAWLAPEDAAVFFEEIVGLIRSGRGGGRKTSRAHDALTRAASARAAVGTSARITDAAVRRLLEDLLRCDVPHSNPDGRPTFIEISRSELARRFHKAPAPGRPDLD